MYSAFFNAYDKNIDFKIVKFNYYFWYDNFFEIPVITLFHKFIAD